MPNQEDLYKIVDNFQKTLAESGFSPQIEKVDPLKEIPKINKRLQQFTYILTAIILVLGVAFIGFVIDALYFHINNQIHYKEFEKFEDNFQAQIDAIKLQLPQSNNEK